MSKQYLNQKIASGLMAALMLSSAVQAPVFASEKNGQTYEMTQTVTATVAPRAGYTALDFSYAGASAVHSVSVAELIYRATGSSVGAEEAAYLASQGISMSYDDSLSSSLVATSAGDDSITFTASAKSYQAYNGTTVRWIPVSVSLDSMNASFTPSPSGYTATFTNLDKDTVYTATFTYQTTITVSAYALTSVVNRAYNDALSVIAAQNRYEQDKEAYDNAVLAYQNACKEYEALYAAYQKYQQTLQEYNAELAAYNAYMKKVNAYNAAMEKYNAYLEALATYDERYKAYEEELLALPEKQAQYEKYLDYLALIQGATKQLAVINSAYIPDSVGRTMYATLMGDTVAQVLARKDELIRYGGADPNDINNAGDATTALQTLLSEYKKLSTTEEQLRWYTEHYQAVKDNFILLYSSLHSLGNNIVVRKVLNKEGKLERYCQFVGQLYIISTGLDDGTTFDSSWSFNDYAIYDLIEASQRVLDDNTYAPTMELPEKMDPVEKPMVPTAPKKPTEVSEPLKTWTEELTHPGEAPLTVAKPKEPALSDYTSGAPQIPEVSTQLGAVVELVKANKLTFRSGSVRDVDMTFTSSFSKSTSLSQYPLVTFYDYDKKTVLYSVHVEKGGTAVYGATPPRRQPDEKHSYEFAGWKDASGNPASLSGITADTAFYASYTETVNTYTVVWHVGGKLVSETYRYGDTPSYKGNPSYRDAIYQYTFAGWSPSVEKVTGNAEYTAQYTTQRLDSLTFAVIFDVRGETYYRTYSYGDMPRFDDFEHDYVWGGYRYVFTGWTPSLSMVTDNVRYTANFEKMFLIPAGEDFDKSADMIVTKTAHTVKTDEYIVDASYAVKEALKANTQLVLELGGAVMTIDNATLQTMPNACYFRLMPMGDLMWRFEITDREGKAVSLASDILVELPLTDEEENGGRLNAYLDGTATSVSVHDDTAYLRLKETGMISLRPYYTLALEVLGNGDLTAEKDTFEVGASVKLNTYLEQGWKLQALTISVDGGEASALTLADGTFVMPDGDVTVSATFAEAEYTIIFMANGEEISREIYRYGEAVTAPDMSDRLSYKDGDTTYTFSGWDMTVSPATKDITYTAKYEKGNVGGVDDTYISDHDSNKLMTIGLPVLLGALTLGIGAFVFFRVRKKKGKNPPRADKS